MIMYPSLRVDGGVRKQPEKETEEFSSDKVGLPKHIY
jgi:hypothetical protein